ncbi:hypothetical protein HJG60_012017 [Phyllostomus discolor]|uniref:Uncharacterized protein n=1 Tax=Phyllostomus discolor TaxID=89673 RepID=A0A833ZLL7_9CHIR|nr:hypothetical protein HJG60_012017 [Phyllostomus discolor]
MCKGLEVVENKAVFLELGVVGDRAPDGPWGMVMDCHRPHGVDTPSSYWVDREARPQRISEASVWDNCKYSCCEHLYTRSAFSLINNKKGKGWLLRPKERHCYFDNLKGNSRNVTNSMTFATKSSNQNFIIFLNKIQATITGYKDWDFFCHC